MDLSTLRRLADEGFAGVPRADLATLASWSHDWAVVTGEARFSILGETLEALDDHWGEQGIPEKLVQRIEKCLQEYMTQALLAGNPQEGAYFADRLRDEVRALPWSIEAWRREGWFPPAQSA